MKGIHCFRAVLLGLALALVLAPVADAGQITIHSTSYQYGTGGEFNIRGIPGVEPYYSHAQGSATWLSRGFESFCLEKGEVFYYNTPYFYTIDSVAIQGGIGPGGDHISWGTALLYSQFAAGSLQGYFGANRYNNAGALQEAIWMLEGDLTPNWNNAFLAYLLGKTNDKAYWTGNAPDGQYGVYVLNVWGDEAHTSLAQSQLIVATPEPATLCLYGAGLLGFGVLRRFRKK